MKEDPSNTTMLQAALRGKQWNAGVKPVAEHYSLFCFFDKPHAHLHNCQEKKQGISSSMRVTAAVIKCIKLGK